MVYDLLKITIPAGLVLYTAYLLMRAQAQKQLEEYRLSLRQKNQEVILPVRLQAYERICLLLERISPNNLIPRVNAKNMTARDLQAALIADVRSEYNHNLSQQVYMSNDAWMYVSGAVEQLISTINEAGNELDEQATSLVLAKKIFEKNMQNNQDTVRGALTYVKNEIKELF